ncbi:hypothetical protein FRX31_030263 [Thalictrum thalictroides]|uniref:Uncharacterized protein n=1 Tax=Thalictrum thalictroides TaxID=46969 RepID=A0A7J6V630_THATH|nr:hypothetical protein FRX31_030263 [Thalictrum thalictroides]
MKNFVVEGVVVEIDPYLVVIVVEDVVVPVMATPIISHVRFAVGPSTLQKFVGINQHLIMQIKHPYQMINVKGRH